MVQSFYKSGFLPVAEPAALRKTEVSTLRRRKLGFEIAFPLTVLVFILLSEHSPLLKMHLERGVDWLCEHDFAASCLEWFFVAIPVWMVAVMICERFAGKREQS